MGVISVGASLGVAERKAGRAPSASPPVSAVSASTVASTSQQQGATASATFPPSTATAASAATATTHNHHSNHHSYHHNARRQHEYNFHSGPSHHQQAAYGGGGRPNKRGGRRKYTQNSNHQHANGNASAINTTSATASSATVPSFPPPPIVTSSTSLSAPASTSASASTTTPSPAGKESIPSRANANVAPVASGNAKRSTAALAVPPSQVVRVVAFETNLDPQLLVPFVLGAKGGARLQGFMTQSKCTMVHRPVSMGPASNEVVIRLGRSGSSSATPSPSSTPGESTAERRLSFTLTADTTNRVDHGLRLLQGAIETAEQILARKKRTSANSAAVAVATQVAVDSGGNSKPSSGHVSVSRAAMPDHSIDDPPPPSLLASSSLSSSSSSSVSSHGHGHGINRDSVDERKAQTRIRYPPTNQPLKRGPGFAPSRSIDELPVNVTTPPATPVTTNGGDKIASKKRQLPSSSDGDTSRREPTKRERTSTVHDAIARPDVTTMTTAAIVSTSSSPQPTGGDIGSAADPEFDEFRIRLTRGIEFARQVDAEAARLKQRVLRGKQKYLQMVQQSHSMKQQQRVADVVIRTQCAIMAASEPSGRKRRRIEQLSAAQDEMKKSLQVTKRKDLISTTSRLAAGWMTSYRSTSTDLAELMKKVSAFRAAISKNAATCSLSGEVDESQSRPVQPEINVSEALSKRDAEATKTTVESEQIHEFGVPEPTSGEKQTDVFRPRHLAPGVLRDMNLIQDYTDESNWGLLRLLIGQRQYFYLEPISLSFGTSDLSRLQFEAIRTMSDLEIMREFIFKRRRFGVDLLKSVQSVAAAQAASSSKVSSWTNVQRSLLEIHPILLVLHLLALHYHAVTVLEQKKVAVNLSKPDLLSNEDELSSDLFKFVLRPIRSSAIESSLNDALPISLVRETIAHCPEVVNHVLSWKEECDVPPALLDDVTSTQSKKDKSSVATSTGSPMLSETLRHLQRHADDFDRSLSELARHIQGLRTGSVSGDKIVHLVNQLKAVGARLLLVNTQLQLHKWATVFVENGFSWFDDDMDDDLDGDSGFGGDRSYDKFTCLQDALFVWHNARLSYSAKDVDGEQHADSEVRAVTTLRAESKEPESEASPDQDREEKDDVELASLRRMTPVDVVNVIETKFTDHQAVAAYLLTSEAIAQTRKDFNDSLAVMRASMKVLGRTAPWRTHVKHSNVLKSEYTKQRELENKLLLHQWAAYYKTRPLPNRPENPDHTLLHDKERDGNMKNVEDEEQHVDDEKQEVAEEETPRNASDMSADQGIVLEPGDTPEVVDMKLLRHEIENVAKQMHSMGDTGPVDADRKKLLDACNLLAASCVSALTKFLSHDEPSQPEAGPVSARAARQRASSISKTGSGGSSAASADPASSRSKVKARQRSKGRAENEEAASTTQAVDDDHADEQDGVHTRERNTGNPEAPSMTRRAKKGSAVTTQRRPRAHSTSSASPRVPPAATPAPIVPSIPSRASESKATTQLHAGTVAAITAEPLRMGCSGCRDTRRRCTGCHGCCLHCVCLGCGCRMCCSSRTASVQKTLNLLVTAVETRMGCKWIELDKPHSERCGMVKACSLCQQCVNHCTCHPSARASQRECAEDARKTHGTGGGASASGTAGFPSASARKERRFRINPTAAQRRQNHASGVSDDDTSGSSGRHSASVGKSSHSTTKRTRRSNSDATPSMFRDDSVDASTGSDFMSSEFSGSSTDGIPFVSSNPPAHHKNEQEDLFRAARVRMKLQRNTVLKATHPYGLIPPNTLIEDEMLWHPDRIRLMWERKDVYAVLGVPREASPQLIKKQYRKLVLKLHPDKALGAGETSDTCSNQGEAWTLDDRVSAFVAVTQAYKLLSGDIGAIHGNAWKMPTTTSL